MAGGTVMLYVLPMLLGSTYDIRKDTAGIQIFNDTTAANSLKVEHYITESQYRMMDSSDYVTDFLDVDGRLSLRIKSGLLNVQGYGSYLKDKSSSANVIEIVVKVNFETVTHSIPTWWEPNRNWTDESAESLGTHYCRSITYGGTLIASILITAKNQQDKERIKGAIQAGTSAKALQGEIEGKLEMLKDELREEASTSVNYYATVNIPGVSHGLDGFLKLVEGFPEHVKKVNGGLGVPLRMELVPLSALNGTFKTYEVNRALNEYLSDMEDEFDDLRITQQELTDWITTIPNVAKSVMDKIRTFQKKITHLYQVYKKAISDLDVTVGASKKPFQDSSEAYRDGEYILPGKYHRKFLRLQREIYKEKPELEPKYGGVTFTRWGKSSCNPDRDNVETPLNGVAIATSVNQHGGSAEYTCSPTNPQLINASDTFSKNVNEYSDTPMYISPLRYRGTLKKFESMQNKMLSCSMCRAARRTSVLVLNAVTSCPQGWTKEYSGLLMAPGEEKYKGQYICVDENMEAPQGKVQFGSTDENDLAEIQEVSAGCGILPCGPYKENVPLPCMVCTR